MKIIAKPFERKDENYEAVTLFKEGDSYPYATVSIDFFYNKAESEKPNSVYRRLHKYGETITFELIQENKE